MIVSCSRFSTQLFFNCNYMGVSKKRGTPKWMVYNFIMENPIQMDDLGVPLFLETPIYTCLHDNDWMISWV